MFSPSHRLGGPPGGSPGDQSLRDDPGGDLPGALPRHLPTPAHRVHLLQAEGSHGVRGPVAPGSALRHVSSFVVIFCIFR